MKPGIHTVSSETYHADQVADRPSLSASLATILLNSSPAHARAAHPRLNENFVAKTDEKFDLGNVVHSLLLQGVDTVEVLAFPDYRTQAAQQARDLARSHGRIPLLTKHAHDVTQMCAAATKALPLFNVDPPLLVDGEPEVTLVWEEAGVTCRARVDWLQNDYSVITDLKTTSRSASADAFKKNLHAIGCDVQAELYRRGMKALTGKTPDWRWLVIETNAPYAMSVITPGPDVLALAEAKVDKALAIWKRCLETDEWPAYGWDPVEVELPPWLESQWLEREAREAREELAA